MDVFVNRNKELDLIDGALDTLVESRRLLRTPIIGFYGVSGIGKSMLLSTIVKRCNEKQLRLYEVTNVLPRTSQLFVDVARELKELLENGEPVIVILDDWDTTHSEHLRAIEATLSDLVDDSNLLIILASKSKKTFDNNKVISNKITSLPLNPLDKVYCESYVDIMYSDADKDKGMHDIVFEWTHGYPIAIKVMIDAMRNKQFDLQREQDQKQLLSIIIDKVVNQSLLALINSDLQELSRFHTLFGILSVPRHCNLSLIQKLIERFAPKYTPKRAWTFPLSINAITPVIDWNEERAGFYIDESIRNLFLLRNRIEQPQVYVEMHKFLAEKNENFARQMKSGLDHIRYLQEFFYHLAHYEAEAHVKEQLVQHIERLMPTQADSDAIFSQLLDNFLQFYKEFERDEELKEVLKVENVRFALTLMRQKFIGVYRYLSTDVRGNYLQNFFACTSSMAMHESFALVFETGIRRIMREEDIEIINVFKDVLLQDQTLREFLGNDFEGILSLFADSSSEER